jgi:flavin-binding protein dodecin
MSDATYKVIELVGTSPDSVQQAIRNGIDRAGQTIRGIDWFEVQNIRGRVENGNVAWFQVDMKVGFRVLSNEELHQDQSTVGAIGANGGGLYNSDSLVQE